MTRLSTPVRNCSAPKRIIPDSLTVLEDCRLEPALSQARTGEPVQFERLGYFCRDPDSTAERPVFNRTLALRDTWARLQAKVGGKARLGT